MAVGLAWLGVVAPAHAFSDSDYWPGYRDYRSGYGDYSYREPELLGTAPRRVRHRTDAGHDGEAAKPAPPKPLTGPVLISVSIGSQHVTVYDNGTSVASAPISSGMKGHPTPMGIFSVIQKEKWHHSNLYSNAPMPYMQRITWSGVALHAGVLPGYPASHGCIRLPEGFAVRLWSMTRLGARVVVARNDVTPFEIEHPRLTALATPPEPPKAPETPAPDAAAPAASPGTTGEAPRDPASAVTVTAELHSAVTRDIAFTAATSVPAATHVEHVAAEDKSLPLRSAVDTSATGPAAPAAPPAPPKLERPLRSGAISLFVSRREGKLFVRKGFEPVFDVPVKIARPDVPLGNYLFTMAQPVAGATAPHWIAVAVGNDRAAPEETKAKARGRRDEAPVAKTVAPAPPSPQVAAAEALDRIELPADVIERIAPYITPGASLTISDQGLGDETGKETDFIVVTR